MTWCFVSILVSSNNSDIFKISNWNGCSVRDECNCDRSRFIRSVYSASCLVEVDNVAILPINQFYHIALRAAQQRWSFICLKECIKFERVYVKYYFVHILYVNMKWQQKLIQLKCLNRKYEEGASTQVKIIYEIKILQELT